LMWQTKRGGKVPAAVRDFGRPLRIRGRSVRSRSRSHWARPAFRL